MTRLPHALIVAEPPPAYAARLPIVVDCSVLAALLFDEALREHAAQALSRRALHAPTLIDYEIASVAQKKHAQGWPADAIAEALSHYAGHAIDLHRPRLPEQCALAQQYGLSVYDAAYLWLAGELKAPLATFDGKLGEAAQRHLSALK